MDKQSLARLTSRPSLDVYYDRTPMYLNAIAQYWNCYQQMHPLKIAEDPPYQIEQFGDTPELANTLGRLVQQETKTATCSSLWEWEAEQRTLTKVGTHTIVLDGKENPLCITKTTEVIIQAFNEVDAQFAYDEGEGDRTLEFWQHKHWRYFERVLSDIGRAPMLTMPPVCERFQVVFPPVD
ncbi:MAG: ASCH domain-containing protein [Cyanobacteria bacterium P01_H01_bin.26]